MDGFSKYHFKDLGESERIIKVVHRNWFYILEQFFLVFAIGGVLLGGLFYAPLLFPEMLGSQHRSIVAFLESSFFLALWIYSFLIWVDYYFDIWIITSERIVNIEQKGMFSRKVSEVTYSKIQDVSTEVHGFVPTILNFGDVEVQTAGEEENFIFRTVSDPYGIKNIIVSMNKKSQSESNEKFGEMISEKVSGR